jgi:uncharacterized protein YdeI (YjbR/CyaY-like superfamily)
MPVKPEYFPAAAGFRAWLREHHAQAAELWVGFHKKGSGVPSMSWDESVDTALCFGWIDGIRKRVDEARYVIRFTARKPRSIWSARNIARVRELGSQGLMEPAGMKALERLAEGRSAVYSYEQRKEARLAPAHERRFRASGKAWEFFRSRAPSYRRTATWWVVSAKREETRLRRLGVLIDASARGLSLDALARPWKLS